MAQKGNYLPEKRAAWAYDSVRVLLQTDERLQLPSLARPVPGPLLKFIMQPRQLVLGEPQDSRHHVDLYAQEVRQEVGPSSFSVAMGMPRDSHTLRTVVRLSLHSELFGVPITM